MGGSGPASRGSEEGRVAAKASVVYRVKVGIHRRRRVRRNKKRGLDLGGFPLILGLFYAPLGFYHRKGFIWSF